MSTETEVKEQEEPADEEIKFVASCVVPLGALPAIAAWSQQMILAGCSVRVDQRDPGGLVEGVAW